jgi:hypothetical protein
MEKRQVKFHKVTGVGKKGNKEKTENIALAKEELLL